MSTEWPCGTPRSIGNAFDLATKPVAHVTPMTPDDINRAKARETWRRKQAEKAATRVNPESHISSPADAAKTAKLIGKRNGARSQ